MAEHTPGPWKTRGTYGTAIGRPFDPYACIANTLATPFVSPAQRCANARLIAAAPEMLAALEAITAPGLAVTLEGAYDAWQKVYAAIDKAKGVNS